MWRSSSWVWDGVGQASQGSSASEHSCQSSPSSFFSRDCKLHDKDAACLFILMKPHVLGLEAKLERWFQEAKGLQIFPMVAVWICWQALSICGLPLQLRMPVGLWGQVAYLFWAFPSFCFGFCFCFFLVVVVCLFIYSFRLSSHGLMVRFEGSTSVLCIRGHFFLCFCCISGVQQWGGRNISRIIKVRRRLSVLKVFSKLAC